LEHLLKNWLSNTTVKFILKYPDTTLLVFAKAPDAGRVNTRLIPHIGVERATQLQHDLIHDRLNKFAQTGLCELQLWCSPDTEHDFFIQCHESYNVPLFRQQGDNLGQRMSHAIKVSLLTHRNVILIGTDAPALGVDEIEKAIQVLHNGNDVVLVPAEDGGYVLIGANLHSDQIFQSIPWGTDEVLKKTREKISQLSLKLVELEECWDIDRAEDYERYLLFRR